MEVTFFESQCLFICDQISLEILDLNQVAVDCIGLSRDSILGKKLTDFAQRHATGGQKKTGHTSPGNLDDVWMLESKSGSNRFVQFTAHMINYKDQPAKFVIAHDITGVIAPESKEPVITTRSRITNFPMAEIEWTKDLRIIRWSDKAEELFGWTEEEALKSETLLLDFVHPEDLPMVKERIEKTYKNEGANISLVNRNVRKDGKVIHCEWHNSLLFNSKGELVSIYSLVHDVSSRVEAREKLTRSMQSYLDLFNSINDAIYLLNADGEILEVNEGVKNVYGYEPREVLGKNYKILGAPGKFDEDRLDQIKRDVKQNPRSKKYQGWGRKKNGEVFPTEFSANPGNYFGEDVVIIIESDVSERIEAEQSLKHREELFRELFETSPIGIALLNQHKEVEMVNEGFENIFGYTEEEIKGLELDRIVVPEEGYDEAHEISKAQTVRQLTGQRRRKDGKMIDVIIYAVPVVVDGQTIALYGIYVDITDRRKAEEKVKESLREKEVLLAEIHHRVKNNLAVITGLLELQSYNTKNREAISVLRDSQMRINSIALVHEKLYQSVNLSEIKIQNYIRELTNIISRTFDPKSSSIDIHFDLEDVNLVITQAIPCGLLLNEILTNCYKHAFRSKDSGDIWISFKKKKDGKLSFTIRDNGAGIPEEDLNSYKGKSLGMKLIRTISKQLKSDTEIKSQDGTIFKFEFEKEKYA